MQNYTTPGVYIVEEVAPQPLLTAVPTAVPVFVGYTEKAALNGKSLSNQVFRITSLVEYIAFFGGAPCLLTTIDPVDTNIAESISLNNKPYAIAADTSSTYYLYNSIRLFYQNGGADCYILSVGDYSSRPALADLSKCFDLLKKEQDPTMVLVPDGLLLPEADYNSLTKQILAHCNEMQSRIGIFDLYDGHTTEQDKIGQIIAQFRDGIGCDFLSHGAAYYPWLNTSVIGPGEINMMNLPDNFTTFLEPAISPVLLSNAVQAKSAAGDAMSKGIADAQTFQKINADLAKAHHALMEASASYTLIINTARSIFNVLPAAPALAGIYTATDNTYGVWKAPANVGINSADTAVVKINDTLQQDLAIDAHAGKSINAIRVFNNKELLVWGARTLDGNSPDWRYINVRRTAIMLEQSIKLMARSFVFEPNTLNTWVHLKCIIENFLYNIWQQGGLVGAKSSDAFNVNIGLGSTMTSEDILDGKMNVVVLVALIHPAEFITFTFTQQMQQS